MVISMKHAVSVNDELDCHAVNKGQAAVGAAVKR